MSRPTEDLEKIAETDDLHIAPFRDDGTTYCTPTWIWSVVVDGALYVRGYNGQASRWYQPAVRQKAGRITAAGTARDVDLEPVDGSINDASRRCVPDEIRQQPLSATDDQHPRTRGHDPDYSARSPMTGRDMR